MTDHAAPRVHQPTVFADEGPQVFYRLVAGNGASTLPASLFRFTHAVDVGDTISLSDGFTEVTYEVIGISSEFTSLHDDAQVVILYIERVGLS